MEERFNAENVCVGVMSKTMELIRKYRQTFPEHEYYSGLLETAEANIESNPDIAIETCKSVVEGLSKTLLDKMNVTYSTRGRNAHTAAQIFRMAVEELGRNVEIDEAFLFASSRVVVRTIELRNERGDISKGRSVPKKVTSDPMLARFVFDVTDSVCVYFFEKYTSIDWSVLDDLKYEENPEFNEFLDSENELPGILLYSKALFEQDRITYEQELQDYLVNNKE